MPISPGHRCELDAAGAATPAAAEALPKNEPIIEQTFSCICHGGLSAQPLNFKPRFWIQVAGFWLLEAAAATLTAAGPVGSS